MDDGTVFSSQPGKTKTSHAGKFAAEQELHGFEQWKKREDFKIKSENARIYERLNNVKAVIPRIVSPYETTNKALMAKHAALSHNGQHKFKKVKLPPVIHARNKCYVKEIDEEFLKTEAEKYEKFYEWVIAHKPHLLEKKRTKFKERHVSSSLRQDSQRSRRDSMIKSVSQQMNQSESGGLDLHKHSKRSVAFRADTKDNNRHGQSDKHLSEDQTRQPGRHDFSNKSEILGKNQAKDETARDRSHHQTSPTVSVAGHDAKALKSQDQSRANDQDKKGGDVAKKPAKPSSNLDDQFDAEHHKDQSKANQASSKEIKHPGQTAGKDGGPSGGHKNGQKANNSDTKDQQSTLRDKKDRFGLESDGNLVAEAHTKVPAGTKDLKAGQDVKNKPGEITGKVEEVNKKPAVDELSDDFFDDGDKPAKKIDKKEPKPTDQSVSKPKADAKVDENKDKKPAEPTKPENGPKKNDPDDFFGDMDEPKKTTPVEKAVVDKSKPANEAQNTQVNAKNATPGNQVRPAAQEKPKKADDLDDFFDDVPKAKPQSKPTIATDQGKPSEDLQKDAPKEQKVAEKQPVPVVPKTTGKPKARELDDLDDFFGDKNGPEEKPAPVVKQVDPVKTKEEKPQPKVDATIKPPALQKAAETSKPKKGDDFDDFFDDGPKKDTSKKPEVKAPEPKPTVKPVVKGNLDENDDDFFNDDPKPAQKDKPSGGAVGNKEAEPKRKLEEPAKPRVAEKTPAEKAPSDAKQSGGTLKLIEVDSILTKMEVTTASPFDEIDELNVLLIAGKNKIGTSVTYTTKTKFALKEAVALPGKITLEFTQATGNNQQKLSRLAFDRRTSGTGRLCFGEVEDPSGVPAGSQPYFNYALFLIYFESSDGATASGHSGSPLLAAVGASHDASTRRLLVGGGGVAGRVDRRIETREDSRSLQDDRGRQAA